ncbi:MAG: hypothetical protein EAY75_10000 [Bacteroidetes bacterium]|nr:MAG: hypothetical protein EAY75_10000 [Bacteroidota bacterium]
MQHAPHILLELESISQLLADAPKHTPYTVDDAYFDALPHDILAQIELPMPQMEVPAGYFEQLPQQVIQKIYSQEIAEELDQIAPLLNTINKNTPYHVPQNYFEQLELPHAQHHENTGKVVLLPKLKTVQKWAAAAIVLAMLGVGLQYVMRPKNTPPQLASTPFPISDTSITPEVLSVTFSAIEDSAFAAYTSKVIETNQPEPSAFYLSIPDNFEAALQSFSVADLEAHINNIPVAPKHG